MSGSTVQALSRTTRRCSRVSPTRAPVWSAAMAVTLGVGQVGDHPPFEQMLFDDAGNVVFLYSKIVHAVGIYGQDDAFTDKANAAAFQNFYFLLQFSSRNSLSSRRLISKTPAWTVPSSTGSRMWVR